MRKKTGPLIWIGTSLLLASLACGLLTPQSTPTSPPPEPTATGNPTELPTETLLPTTAPSSTPTTATTKTPTETTAIQCTTLQDVNLRTGPGLAYRNPIGVVLEGTTVEPVGYIPDGIPSGSWIMIETGNGDKTGWITAGDPYLDCDADLNNLPEVDVVPPPPPPLPQSVQTSDAEGGCGPNEDYQCDVIVTRESFIQFKIFQNGGELTEDDNVEHISFSVRQGPEDANGPEVYSVVEAISDYCILGGNGPCNNWPLENNVTTWPDGSAVIPGVYFVEIIATVNENGDDIDVRWAAEFTISLP